MPTTLANLSVGTPVVRGDQWDTGSFSVKSGETFVTGAPLKFHTDGTVQACAVGAIGANEIIGFALDDAAPALVTGRQIKVFIPLPGLNIKLPVYHTTAASAVLAQSDIDTMPTYPLKLVTGGILVADKENDSTNDAVRLIEKDESQPYSEQYGAFWWEFLAGGCARGKA